MVETPHGVGHNNRQVRVRRMNNDDIINKRNGNRISVQIPQQKIRVTDEWLNDTSNTSGRLVKCQTEDWPGSTPNPILEICEHVSTHATEEVLVIGSGTSVGTQFRQVYLTHGIRDDRFAQDGVKTGGRTRNIQRACLTILDTLRKVLTGANIPVSLLELMRVGPKFMIIDMATSVFYRDLERGGQNKRCVTFDDWLRAACNTSAEHGENELTTNESRDVSNDIKVYPEKEAPLTGEEPTDMPQHSMKLSALFEFRTTQVTGAGLTGGKGGKLIADMVAAETAQQLASKMYELVINADKKRQRLDQELPGRRQELSKSSKLGNIIYDVLGTTAHQLTDGEHISVNDAELSRQREEFLEVTEQSSEFQDFANMRIL